MLLNKNAAFKASKIHIFSEKVTHHDNKKIGQPNITAFILQTNRLLDKIVRHQFKKNSI